ncbi:MAG: PQQ-binding-like beta-propeller repeat protein [Chloroflexi bacterium]|nr:PQQ-binding-like beta-propeller repeat protein [Chloroflexota bacterium]MBT5628320.1 PQQ-binding-like beta-propeller repeat protein [Chloroflexota bacterium]
MSKQRILNSRRRLPVLFALVFVMFAAVACVNDLTPEGGWSGPVVEENDLFIGNGDGYLVRFDTESGNLENSWRYPSGDGLGAMYSNAVVLGENIYSVGYTCRGDKCDGEIFGLSLDTGSSIWGQKGLELKTKLVGDIGVSGDTLFVGTTAIGDEEDSAEGYFYAIDSSASASSIAKWRVALDGNAFTGVAVEGSTAFIGTMAGTLYAIDISNPDDATNASDRIKWTFEASGAIAGPILAENGSLYFGDLGSNAYKLDISSRSTASQISDVNSGNGEWIFDAGAWVWAKPVIEDGTVYVSALSGTVFAIDDSTGSEKWSSSIEGQIVSSPTLFDRKRGDTRERALAVPSGEKNVWVMSVIDGRELGVFVTDEPVKSTPLVYNELLYVHALNGDLKWYSVDDTNQRGCVDLKGGGRCD